MNNVQYYKQQASNKAKRDFYKGLNPDPTRHGALKVSAWAQHYNESFKPAEDLKQNSNQILTAEKIADIQEELQQICEAFNIGNLRSWRQSKEQPVEGYLLTEFNTTIGETYKHWFKL